MYQYCALCDAELIESDFLNKLSDGGVLCENCLERVGNINEDVVYNLQGNSLLQIQEIIKYNIRPRSIIGELPVEKITAKEEIRQDELIFQDHKKTQEKFKQQIEDSGADLSMFMRGELKQLPHVLDNDEKIIAAIEARDISGFDGLLVVTQKRVVYVQKYIFTEAKFVEFLNENIDHITWVEDIKIPIMNIFTNKEKIAFSFKNYMKAGKMFYYKIDGIYNKPKLDPQLKTESFVKKETSEQIFSRLERLSHLYENGLLTQEEFTELKKKYLDKI